VRNFVFRSLQGQVTYVEYEERTVTTSFPHSPGSSQVHQPGRTLRLHRTPSRLLVKSEILSKVKLPCLAVCRPRAALGWLGKCGSDG
jgi:hypothetical protein